MRKNHTLTFNETTYIINDGKTTNSIFINGLETDWYIEYAVEAVDDINIPTGIRLKNRNDEDNNQTYGFFASTHMNLYTMVRIIEVIEENSFRNN